MTHREVYQKVVEDIKNNPDKHRHTFEQLTQCCMVNGALDLSLMEAHEGLATNLDKLPPQLRSDSLTHRRTRCDVISGPCSCGGWH